MNPITSPIARATARFSIIERNPIVRPGFRLITTRYIGFHDLTELFNDCSRTGNALPDRIISAAAVLHELLPALVANARAQALQLAVPEPDWVVVVRLDAGGDDFAFC
jgi:hypothetical protein